MDGSENLEKNANTLTHKKSIPRLLGEKKNEILSRESVMYAGHLFAAAGLYTVLFKDMAFTKINSLKFDYESMFPGTIITKRFKYNLSSLAEFIYGQYEVSPMGFICEGNAIFLFCNMYTFHGFK